MNFSFKSILIVAFSASISIFLLVKYLDSKEVNIFTERQETRLTDDRIRLEVDSKTNKEVKATIVNNGNSKNRNTGHFKNGNRILLDFSMFSSNENEYLYPGVTLVIELNQTNQVNLVNGVPKITNFSIVAIERNN